MYLWTLYKQSKKEYFIISISFRISLLHVSFDSRYMRLQIDAKRSKLLPVPRPISHAVALAKTSFAVLSTYNLNLALENRLIFNPSPKKTDTMVSADFFTLSRTSLYGLQRSEAISLGQCVQ